MSEEISNGANGTSRVGDTTENGTPSTRVALVTGAAQGIGREIALRLARDGLDIALNDIPNKLATLESTRDEILNLSGSVGRKQSCVVLTGDVSKEEDVARVVESVVGELGGLDVMVANAGICIVQPLEDLTTVDFDQTMNVNVRGVMLCYKHAARQMIKQGRGGRIIGASSIAGKSGLPYLSAYVASKFAVRGLTQCAALELGKYGITVNAYAPGAISTTMMESYDSRVAEIEAPQGRKQGDLYKQLATQAALGRSGKPAEVANLVSYLASNEAQFITGQSVIIDGGIVFD